MHFQTHNYNMWSKWWFVTLVTLVCNGADVFSRDEDVLLKFRYY